MKRDMNLIRTILLSYYDNREVNGYPASILNHHFYLCDNAKFTYKGTLTQKGKDFILKYFDDKKWNDAITILNERKVPISMFSIELMYDVSLNNALQQLARGATSAHRVYTCPNCGRVETITLITGEMPKCEVCGKDVTYIYEADN